MEIIGITNVKGVIYIIMRVKITELIKNKYFRISVGVTIFFVVLIIVFYITGILWIGELSSEKYPVQGVDVSHYQGIIDWEVLAGENIDFAFIKATEGSGTQDTRFEYNWEEAHKTDLKVGAYHFFSFDSEGSTQADNYIATVPVNDNALPPVIDVEFYGDKKDNSPKLEDVKEQLGVLISRLENTYGKTPIIYCTYSTYVRYIKDNFDECTLWIRNTYYKPGVFDGVDWTIWQYTDEGKKAGYDGYEDGKKAEEYIDLNVFNGTKDEFEEFCR